MCHMNNGQIQVIYAEHAHMVWINVWSTWSYHAKRPISNYTVMQKVYMLFGIRPSVSINGFIFGWLAIYTSLLYGEFSSLYGV